MDKCNSISKTELQGYIDYTKISSGFIANLAKSKDARDTVIGLLKSKTEKGVWSGYSYVPPLSAADIVTKAFEAHTDIPLELPFHAFLFYLSGYLMEKNVRIRFAGRNRTPEIWTVVLAPSGCGKSFSSKIIGRAAPVLADFPECASGAKFLEAMFEHQAEDKAMLWMQDEFAQKLKQIENTGSPLADAKDYLLRAYDGSRIERNTKTSGSIVVENPCLSILGLNTDEGFYKAISPESLVDGFAQRFGFVVAQRDPKRPMKNFPIYAEDALDSAANQAFGRILNLKIHPVYEFGPIAEVAFRTVFEQLADSSNVPESFYRRVMFRVVKYALFYHLMLNKESDQIDADDVGWAGRLCRQHLVDAKIMLCSTLSDLQRMIDAAERVKNRVEAAGKQLTPRDIVRGVHGIKSVAEARGLLALLSG